jgi:hypothetical protein
MRGLRVMIYDATCTGGRLAAGLTHAWWVGSHLYRALGRIDASFGARRWDEALAWIVGQEPDRSIDEVQLWMHGKWGAAFLERDRLDERALLRGSPHRAQLDALAARLHEGSLLWFRTCETFGAHAGQRFAAACAERLGCRVAGHTHVIGDWQSGLHSLRPGEAPRWPPEEGLLHGTAAAPERARWSTPLRPHTIHCLQGRVPAGW